MDNEASASKFIVFTIADHLLALPIATVLKVVNCPPANNGDPSTTGLIQIGHHTLVVLDLHQKLANSYAPKLTRKNPFLVITQVLQGELYAIPVDEPPNLVELTRDSLRASPKSSHQYGLLDIVSHIAVLSEEEKSFTIFILDINRTLSAITNSTTPRLISRSSSRGEPFYFNRQ